VEVQHYRDLITEAREQFNKSVSAITNIAIQDKDISSESLWDLYQYTDFKENSDPLPEQNDPTSYQYGE